VAVVGASVNERCGVRDHATLLADAAREHGVQTSLHWLSRTATGLSAARAEDRAWTASLAGAIAAEQADAILLHYSVFSYSHRGIPIFVPPMLAALRSTGSPVITFAHELVYPWRHGGAKGKVWSVTQRAALIDVMRSSASIVVTADFRAEWLAQRRWLPSRPVMLAPVFSNLPVPAPRIPHDTGPWRLGLFGYSYQGAALELTLDALRLLADGGLDVSLELLGAPGRDSAVGRAWLAGARARGVEEAVGFSGSLPAQELSDAVAACDVLLYADEGGPSSRKGTLAGSLASGRPIVAIDGRRRWQLLVEHDALRVTAAAPQALAAAVAALIEDEGAREALGARGRAFAEREMSLGATLGVVLELLARAQR